MTKAVVIKTIGDNEIAGAIVEGMTRRVIPMNTEELAVIKAELARYKARNGLRAYGDEKRLRTAKSEMARKYSSKPTKPIVGAILGVYGLFCLGVAEAYARLAEWNRS